MQRGTLLPANYTPCSWLQLVDYHRTPVALRWTSVRRSYDFTRTVPLPAVTFTCRTRCDSRLRYTAVATRSSLPHLRVAWFTVGLLPVGSGYGYRTLPLVSTYDITHPWTLIVPAVHGWADTVAVCPPPGLPRLDAWISSRYLRLRFVVGYGSTVSRSLWRACRTRCAAHAVTWFTTLPTVWIDCTPVTSSLAVVPHCPVRTPVLLPALLLLKVTTQRL